MLDRRLFSLTPHISALVAAKVLALWVSLLTDIAFAFALVDLLAPLFGSVASVDAGLDGAVGFIGREVTQAFPNPWIGYAIVFVCIIVVKYVATRLSEYFGVQVAEEAKVALRGRLYSKMLDLGPAYAQQVRTSDVVQSAGEGIDQIQSFFQLFLPQLFFALLAPVTLCIALLPVNIPSALTLLVCAPMIIVIMGLVAMTAARIFGKYWTSYTDLGATFLDNLQGMETLKTFSADGQAAARMDVQAERFRKATMKVLQIELQSLSAMDLVAYGGAAAGMGVAIWQCISGHIGLGGAAVVVLLAVSFFLPLRQLGSFFHVAMNGMTSSKRIFALLDVPVPQAGSQELPSDADCVEVSFDKVSYDYNGAETKESNGSAALSQVSFASQPRTLTAIVGASGSGKSTAAALLAGSLRGYTGSLRLDYQSAQAAESDGSDRSAELRDLTVRALANAVTLVTAQSHLFPVTLRENLAMAAPQAGEDEMWTALERAHIDDFVRATPEGLDMPIDQDGRNLSGGQRQRIAIARALMRRSPVYVFDEATSSVDAESERLIIATIHDLARTSTVIMVTHRLADAVDADTIVVFEAGRIAQVGSHADLMTQDGAYASLYEAQGKLERSVYGDADSGAHPHKSAQEGMKENAWEGEEPVSSAGTGSPASSVVSAASAASAAPTGSAVSRPEVHRESQGNLALVRRLLGEVGPLKPFMIAACCFGVIGHLAATFLPVFALTALLAVFGTRIWGLNVTVSVVGMVVCALLRGAMRYTEQFMNHNLAFRLLALFRSKAFAALRRLAPAKLAGKGSGDLVALITTDVEKLEIFFAHTISPVVIALVTSVVYAVMLATLQPWYALLLIVAHLLVGVLMPKFFASSVRGIGAHIRSQAAALDNVMLDDMRGLDEIIRYGRGRQRLDDILSRSRGLWDRQRALSRRNGVFSGLGGAAVTLATLGAAALAIGLAGAGAHGAALGLTAVLLVSGSFGPVLALNALPGNLTQTFASARRLFALFDEDPAVCEQGTERPAYSGMSMRGVSFRYGTGDAASRPVLDELDFDVPASGILGVQGASGRGKSTMLKLLMRYWDPQSGSVVLSGVPLPWVDAAYRRNVQTMMSQETYLFDGSIRENLLVADPNASEPRMRQALERAAVLDLVDTLPGGLDANVGELGGRFSEGERQRIGLARIFLTDADLVLLDEPTSRLDTLNEAVILRSIRDLARQDGKAVLLVSHRDSTMAIAERVVRL